MLVLSRPLFARFVFVASLGLSLVLSGCGRKGDLDVPGQPPMKQSNSKAKPKVPERHFFLDPIL
jgi:predicted small lipoprotein YifL